MQALCYQYLNAHPDIKNFVRFNPIWYRYLTRDPNRIYELRKEADIYYGNTFGQKVERIHDQLKMVDMFFQLVNAMKD